MAQTSSTKFQHPGTIYKEQPTSAHQSEVFQNGTKLDMRAGSSFSMAGDAAISGTLNITGTHNQQTPILLGATGEIRFAKSITRLSSNSTNVPNNGIVVLQATEAIAWKIDAPSSGSWVKIVAQETTDQKSHTVTIRAATNAASGGKKVRFGYKGRTITLTSITPDHGPNFVELVGFTSGTRAIWYPISYRAGGSTVIAANLMVPSITISTSTA